VGSRSRISVSASVDFPQPDSPTTPSVSPSRTSKGDAVDRLHRLRLRSGQPIQQRIVLVVVLLEAVDGHERVVIAHLGVVCGRVVIRGRPVVRRPREPLGGDRVGLAVLALGGGRSGRGGYQLLRTPAVA